MIIREEEPHEYAAIYEIVARAFGQADEADLVDRLRSDGDAVISLVADDGDAIVGHVMLSKMTAPFEALGLAPVSVRPDFQRSGIASLLIREALTRARQGGWDAVFVLGDPEFYCRFGFDAEAPLGFVSPYAGPHFMVLPLRDGLPAATGKVDYAPAFSVLD